MTKEHLVITASKLKNIGSKASNEYNSKKESFVANINESMAIRPDIEKLIGNDNITMMKDNHANHARFMASIMTNYNPNVMVDTCLWVFNAYQNHGFHSQYWAAQLNSWLQIIRKELSADTYKEIEPFYNWMQVNIPQFAIHSKDPSNLSDISEHH